MATLRHVAIVSDSRQVKVADLVPVASALQIQVTRDFVPAWNRPATVTAYDKLENVPLDAWPIVVRDTIPFNAEGIHLDNNGAPFALVRFGSGWSLTTSHECLEMLADPLGKRMKRAPSVKSGQGAVDYLVEVCDPSEADAFAYQINQVVVSDFYFPSYFTGSTSRYSFTGAITKARQVLKGGYLSWRVPATKEWWQQRWFNTTQPQFVNLGVFAKGKNPRRVTDDAVTIPERVLRPARSRASSARDVRTAARGQSNRADGLRAEVDRIVAAAR